MPRPDFGKAATDYASFRKPFPDELFDRLFAFSIGTPGQLILDLAAGTGLMGRELKKRACQVVAVDLSIELLRHGEQKGAVAQAEALPFASNTFDAVVAAQSWHWFDRRRAPSAVMRVLRAEGCIAAVYQMHVPTPGSIAQATEELILRFNPRWRHANSAGINGQVLRDLQSAGFTQIESFSFDVVHQFTAQEWRGMIRTTSAVGPSLATEQLNQFDEALARMLEDHPAVFQIPHRVFAAVGRKP
jgi:ubiquinone/menaquinone biosynthesis C-methylase UbiE